MKKARGQARAGNAIEHEDVSGAETEAERQP